MPTTPSRAQSEHEPPPRLVLVNPLAHPGQLEQALAASGADRERPVELKRRGRPALGRPESMGRTAEPIEQRADLVRRVGQVA